MGEFPEIVRQRLRQQPTGSHPDADLLAAFAEHALAGGEREQVLEHLARCADCREVVALAALTPEHEPSPAAPASHRREWLVLRWGGLAAAIAVILVAVVAIRPRMLREREASAPAAVSEVAKPAESPAAMPQTTIAPETPRKPLVETTRAQQKKAEARAAPAAPASDATQVLTAEAKPPAPAASAAQVAPSAKTAVRPSDVDVIGGIASQNSTEAAREPGRAGKFTRKNAPISAEQMMTSAAVVVRWTISPEGKLQRSYDSGRSWADIELGEGATFQAVSALGGEVWVGGKGGALYHSSDSGETWQPVPVNAADRHLAETITAITIIDPMHVTVVTRSGEWTTPDGGKTWEVSRER